MNKFIEKLISKKWLKVISTILVFGYIVAMNILYIVLSSDGLIYAFEGNTSLGCLYLLLIAIFVLSIICAIFLLKFIVQKYLMHKSSNIENAKYKNYNKKVYLVVSVILCLVNTALNFYMIFYTISNIISAKRGTWGPGIVTTNDIKIIVQSSFILVFVIIFTILLAVYFAFLIKKLLQKPKLEELNTEDINKEVSK